MFADKFPSILDIEGLGQNEVNADSKSSLHGKSLLLKKVATKT